MSIARLLIVLMLVVLAASAAAADSVMYTAGPVPGIPITNPANRTDWVSSLMLPKFDPALGTLTSIDITLTGSLQTVLTVTNNSPNPSSGNARTHVEITVKDPLLLIPNDEMIVNMLSPAFSYNLPGGGSATSGQLNRTMNAVFFYTDQSILNEFTGVGDINLNVNTFTETLLANTGGNTEASQETFASASSKITYNFTPIPEPSSLLACLTCIGGAIGVIRYRKR